MNRKGQSAEYTGLSLRPVMNLIVVFVLIFVPLFIYVNSSLSKDTGFERTFLSRDISMILDSAMSLPGDLNLLYPVPFSDMDITIDKTGVIVSEEGDTLKESTFSMHPINVPAYFAIDNRSFVAQSEGASFSIVKSTSSLAFGEQIDLEDHVPQLTCRSAEHEGDTREIDVFMHAYYEGSEEENSPIISIVNLHDSHLIGRRLFKISSSDGQISEPEGFADKASDILLIIQAGEYPEESTGVSVSYPIAGDSSRAQVLACNIANMLTRSYDILDKVPTPRPTDWDALQAEETVSVLIEVGDLDDEDGFLSDPEKLFRAIFGGIDDYYGEPVSDGQEG